MITLPVKWKLGVAVAIITLALAWLSLGWVSDLAFQRGLQAKREWRLSQAIKYFAWSRRLKRSSVAATLELGICQQLRGEFLASQRELALIAASPSLDATFQARLFNAQGVNLFNLNQSDDAISRHERSLALAQSSHDQRLQADALIGLSRVLYHSKGKFQEAQRRLEEALELARAAQDETLEADALRNLGVVYWWFKAELERPLRDFYFPALALYRHQHEPRGEASTLSNIGLLYSTKGDVFEALKYQNEGIVIRQRIGDLAGLADSYAALGGMFEGIENYRKAQEYFASSLDLCKRIGYQLTQNDVETRLAGVYVNLDEIDQALSLLQEQVERESANPLLAKYRHAALAGCYQLKGEHVAAIKQIAAAQAINDQIAAPDARFRIATQVVLADSQIALGNLEQAADALRSVRESMIQRTEIDWAGALHANLVLADLSARQGNLDQALEYLEEAADVEAQVFANSGTNFVLGPHRGLYARLFAFLLDRPAAAGPGGRAWHEKAARLAFRFLEQLRYKSIRNFMVQVSDKNSGARPPRDQEDDLLNRIQILSQQARTTNTQSTRAALRQAYSAYEDLVVQTQLALPRSLMIQAARPVKLEDLRQHLDESTAVVEFIVAEERVFALVLTRSGIHSVTLPSGRAALFAKVRLFRARIFDEHSGLGQAPAAAAVSETQEWLPVAASLRSAVIGPLEQSGSLKGISRLCIVSFGLLHDLPFAALVRSDGQGTHFLIEDYTLFHSPSATFLDQKLADKNALVAQPNTGLISFGRNVSGVVGVPPLDFAADEAQIIAQMYGGLALTNEAADETRMKQLAPRFRYVHLATHGVFEADMPLLSRLLLQPTGQDDGLLTAREIFDLGLRADLVTLSACQTGQSFSNSGNGDAELDRVGLIEAFLHSGANSVLASSMPISDRATLEFMKAFYKNLRTQNQAEALAMTQLAMLRGELAISKDNQRRLLTHPRYWSPFILIGAGR